MSIKKQSARVVACTMMSMVVLPTPLLAAPLAFSTLPPTGAYRLPAPNVIVSVDDSFSMEAPGIQALKDAIKATFDGKNVPDGAIRLAWQSLTDCYDIPAAGCGGNAMHILDTKHRKQFFGWVDTLAPRYKTPSHRMLNAAGTYLQRPVDKDSAWAAIPGERMEPVLACRRAYNLFMTDGGWNGMIDLGPSEGDADGTSASFPDGTGYDVSDDQTRIYRSTVAGKAVGMDDRTMFPTSTTFADLAFRFWATDLQPGIPNKLQPIVRAKGDSTFASAGKSTTLSEYWNPKNDPATWQHLNLYTVGFNGAAKWSTPPLFGSDTWSGTDYARMITGDLAWPDPFKMVAPHENERSFELWHAALNGRGKFIPARSAGELTAAFKDVLNEVLTDTSTPTSTMSASSQDNRIDTGFYVANYSPANWTGSLTAYLLAANTGSVNREGVWKLPGAPASAAASASPSPTVKAVSTADIMDAKPASWPAQRLVLSANASPGGTTVGIPWEWDQLSPAQQLALRNVEGVAAKDPQAERDAQDRLQYLRGDRTRESIAPGTSSTVFRQRQSRQGDIVNSKLWYLGGRPASGYTHSAYPEFRDGNRKRASMLYVGGNDGMLHGFDAATGDEKIAYVPAGLHLRLGDLTSPGYQHEFFVDGSPLSGDVFVGNASAPSANGWRTYLAGFLGAGGRGYFVLDVTDPANFSANAASDLVVLDNTTPDNMDADVGHVFSSPVMELDNPAISRQITRMNDGRWALVTGNGYNSASEKAVLLIQYLDGDKSLRKVEADATVGAGNGLSAPRLVDLDGNGTPELAYAGDLKGNLWRFDLSSDDASNWTPSMKKKPLYTAKSKSGTPQPITSAPVWRPHPSGGIMVAFGTGRNLTSTDPADSTAQTLYGLFDPMTVQFDAVKKNKAGNALATISDGTPVPAGRDELVEQTSTKNSTASASTGAPLWTMSDEPIKYTDASGLRGWYYDLPITGERALDGAMLFAGNVMTFPTDVPAKYNDITKESCDPPNVKRDRYYTTINIVRGTRPTSQVYAYRDGSNTNSEGTHATRIKDADGIQIKSGDKSGPCLAAPGQSCEKKLPVKYTAKRTSWRQLQ